MPNSHMHPEVTEIIKEAAHRGRGLSVFNVDPVSQDRCSKLLRDCVENLQVVDLASTDPLLLEKTTSDQGQLFINASRSCVEPRSKFIYRRIVELYRFQRFPIYFLSGDPEELFFADSLWNATENTVDEDLLFLELIPQALRLPGHFFPSPTHLLDHHVEDLKWTTPIEKILAEALTENAFGFTPQYRVGRYQVDFLVTKESGKIFVECDGAAFHSTPAAKARDSTRDEYIRRETGVPIIRLTGSELFRNPASCVEKISAALLESSGTRNPNSSVEDILDETQKRAAMTASGPVRVLAPPGAGKTRTLVNRCIHLVGMGLKPDRLLAMAFNKKAKQEMQDRLLEKGVAIHVSTLHAFAYRHLKEVIPGLRPIDGDWGKRRVLSGEIFSVMERHGIALKKVRGSTATIWNAIQEIKETLAPAGRVLLPALKPLSKAALPDEKAHVWANIFEEIVRFQESNHLLTFSDFIYLTVRYLARDRSKRIALQKGLDALLVDEFQDLNASQHQFLSLLMGVSDSVYVVADDDQMIYGWRGASLRQLRDFPGRFPGCETLTLSTNYRSPRRVIRHSQLLISHNQMREQKNVSGHSEERGFVEAVTDVGLHKCVAGIISSFKDCQTREGTDRATWSNFSILVRHKEYYLPLIQGLQRAGIPYVCEDIQYYSTPTTRTIAAYLQIVLESERSPGDLWAEIINLPNRYISQPTVNTLRGEAEGRALIENLASSGSLPADHLKHLLEGIDRLHNRYKAQSTHMRPSQLIRELDQEFKIKQHLGAARSGILDGESGDPSIIFEVLQDEAQQFSTVSAFLKYLGECRQREEAPDMQSEKNTSLARLEVMTIHKAKGREWRYVAIFNPTLKEPKELPAGVTKQDWIEEERRIVNVGVTRAQKGVIISFLSDNKNPFIREFLLDINLRQHETPVLESDIRSLMQTASRKKQEAASHEMEFREQAGKLEPMLQRWKLDEEEKRSELNDVQFKESILAEQLEDAVARRQSVWKWIGRIGLFYSDERRLRAELRAARGIKELLLQAAEKLAREQARTKATIDKFKERLQKSRADLREVEDRLDALESEVGFRHLLKG